MAFTTGTKNEWKSAGLGILALALGAFSVAFFGASRLQAFLLMLALLAVGIYRPRVFRILMWPFYFLARLFWSILGLLAWAWYLGGERMAQRERQKLERDDLTAVPAEQSQYRRAGWSPR